MIRTCTYPHLSNKNPQKLSSQINRRIVLIRNRFHKIYKLDFLLKQFLIDSTALFLWRHITRACSWVSMLAVAHLAWKKGVCRGGAAFDIIFQHKTAFSLKTTNRPMNFAMLPKYHIGKILPIYSMSAIFAHKSRYARFLHGVFGNPSCYFVSD